MEFTIRLWIIKKQNMYEYKKLKCFVFPFINANSNFIRDFIFNNDFSCHCLMKVKKMLRWQKRSSFNSIFTLIFLNKLILKVPKDIFKMFSRCFFKYS